VGDPDDVVPDSFGPDLPAIRDWTQQHYDFAGYVTGFDPRDLGDRAALGYRDDERVCIVTVGGSGVGGHLLRRVIAAFPEAKERVPDLRMIVVAGPRIDPDSLPRHDGLEIRDWTEQHYDFAGYVTGFDVDQLGDYDELRDQAGFAPDERVCVVAVGGSGVGAHLLRRVMQSFPEAKRLVPELRMIVVAGPRIDPAALPQTDGLEVRRFVPNLYRHLAACDIGVVQGV
jgi:predicted glycosyltransferase